MTLSREELNEIYQKLLNRDADPSGIASYSNCEKNEVIGIILSSEEYLALKQINSTPAKPVFGDVNVEEFLKRKCMDDNHMAIRYSERWARDRFKKICSIMNTHMYSIRDKKVLDFAAGDSPWYSEIIATSASSVIAMDAMLKDGVLGNVTTKFIDWTVPGFLGDDVYDFILFTEGIEHVVDYKAIIAYLVEHCSGLLLFTYPYLETKGKADASHVNFFRKDSHLELFDDVVNIEYDAASAYVVVRGSKW